MIRETKGLKTERKDCRSRCIWRKIRFIISLGFRFPLSILSASAALRYQEIVTLLWHWWGDLNVRVWGSLCVIITVLTTVPRFLDDSNPSLGFAEGMPSMEVVKLWQSLPNEGHPMLLSLMKTMESINFVCVCLVVFVVLYVWYIYIDISTPG